MCDVDQSGFELKAAPGGTDLIVTGAWTPAAARALATGRADGLVCNYALGFREQTLEFIAAWPLRRFELLARTIENLEPIYRLSETMFHVKVKEPDPVLRTPCHL